MGDMIFNRPRMSEDRILQKLDEHDEILADHSERLEFIREHMVFRENLERFATKEDLKRFATKEDFQTVQWDILGIKEEMKHFATKEELFEMRNDLLTVLDEHMVILRRLDRERVSTIHRLDRHETDIDRLKKHVHLV